MIFATSTPEDRSTRCWYGSVVGSYRSRDYALKQATSLNPFALSDRSLEEGARALQLEANFRQVSSAAFCITAVASSMGLAAPICLLGMANSWQAWGELDAVNASQGNLNGAAASSMTDWPYEQVVGLQKVVQNASSKVTRGQSCPNTPPPGRGCQTGGCSSLIAFTSGLFPLQSEVRGNRKYVDRPFGLLKW